MSNSKQTNSKKIKSLKAKALIIVMTIAIGGYAINRVVEKNIHLWLPEYIWSIIDKTNPVYSIDQGKHLMFLIADHHEHPLEDGDAKISATNWYDDYRSVVDGITDSYGNPFRYTWFYPYDDERTPSALVVVNQMVYDGYGELEFHWHNSHVTATQFRKELESGVNWFNGFGAMKTAEKNSRSAFGYVAGNWNLDNGLMRPSKMDGPTYEIRDLKSLGGYADFTFPNHSASQSHWFSSLYYVKDDESPKSYDEGKRASVEESHDDFLIFQGPTSLDFRTRATEYGTLESWWRGDWGSRIENWWKNSPYVIGKPAWRFIKVYTHGVQSKDLILSDDFKGLLKKLVTFCEENNIKLHFVSAREAFNILKAAETDAPGDPEQYRDYLIPKRVNQFVHVSRKVDKISYYDGTLNLVDSYGGAPLIITVKDVLIEITGGDNIRTLRVRDNNEGGKIISFNGEGYATVQTVKPVSFEGVEVLKSGDDENSYHLRLLPA